MIDKQEIEKRRAEYRLNCACRKAIEDAIADGFDGMHLQSGLAQKVIDQFSKKRTGFVLSTTLTWLDCDGRFSNVNRSWFAEHYPVGPRDEYTGIGQLYDFCVNSHPAILDGFMDEFRKVCGKEER